MTFRARLAWFWTLVILFLCWLPKQYMPGGEKLPRPFFVMNFDKFVHMGIFTVFAVLWLRTSQSKHRVWWVLFAGVALAVITEVGQDNRIVNRDANVADALADILGVVVGLLGCWIASRLVQKQRSNSPIESTTP